MASLLPVAFYLVAAWLIAQGLRTADASRRWRVFVAGSALGLAAGLLHLGVFAQAALVPHGVDLHFFAALSAAGCAVAVLCAIVALRRAQLAGLGLVVYPLAALCSLAYGLRGPVAAAVSAPTWQIQLHAALALLAYATLSLGAVVAIMVWLQERALRRRQLAIASSAFPPLTSLETLLFRLIGAGFALLTLALLSGVVFVEDMLAQHLWHKTVFSVLAWIVFGALLIGRWRFGWRSRHVVRLVLTAMALLVLAFFGSKFVLELVLGRALAGPAA
jgi:ABC-type uncharacterized transport system permease subunit